MTYSLEGSSLFNGAPVVANDELFAEEIPSLSYLPKLHRIATSWHAIASRKLEAARESLTIDDEERFRDSKSITQALADETQLTFNKEREGNFLICRDKRQREVKAILCYIEDGESIYLISLATHPLNLQTSIKEKRAVRGAGSLLLAALTKIAELKGREYIELAPYYGARPFYLKCGFTPHGARYMRKEIKHRPSS